MNENKWMSFFFFGLAGLFIGIFLYGASWFEMWRLILSSGTSVGFLLVGMYYLTKSEPKKLESK